MRIVDELKIKKDFEHDKLEIFNKWWYGAGYKKFKNCIIDNLYLSDDKVFKCYDSILLNYAPEIAYNRNALELRFIRSKLWNEGINFKLTLDKFIIISVRQPQDKYNDCFDLSNIRTNDFIVSNVDKTFLAEFANVSVVKIENLIKNVFNKSVEVENNNVKKINKSKNKKNKSIKNRLPSVSGSDITITDEVNIDIEMDALQGTIAAVDCNLEPLEIIYDN